MHSSTDEAGDPLSTDPVLPKPPGVKELSPRAILCGLVVAAVMGASYPYVVLKLGFGPNVSVVAAILGYIFLGLLVVPLLRVVGVGTTSYNRWENNMVQTAGTAAAQTAFMCVLLAAFDLLAQDPTSGIKLALSPVQSFAWLTSAGLLGVLLAVPLRRHFIVDEKLPFPDGVAAGQTVIVCDSAGPAAVRAAGIMVAGMIASALLMACWKGSYLFNLFDSTWILFPSVYLMATGFGVEWSLLAVGSGMLIGLRINTCMLVGTILSWAIAPCLLDRFGVLPEGFKRNDVLFWVMWPATGMMVSGGLAGLFLRWKVLAKSFRNLGSLGSSQGEFPMKWVIGGSIVAASALVLVQRQLMGQPVWITLAAIVLSLPLALVGLRVLGETNWGPVSALSNMMQGVFALIAPGNVSANMVASGTTGTVVIESEAIMQDYRAGQMIGSTPRNMTIMQLLATPIGAAAVSWIYPVLTTQYGLGGEKGLSSPISVKWAGFAKVLSKGIDALPPGAFTAFAIGCVLGITFAVLETLVKDKRFIPSPTGLGIGMLVPASVIVTMFVGGVVGTVWSKLSPRTAEGLQVPLASGLIAGEAMLAVLVPLLVLLGLIQP
jgi:uncharacterized oligopeptide transporter (OPT) family protein